jgi:hypothetical protein
MRTRSINTKWKWVGALAAVFVPSMVMALTIPHEFNAGDPIVSADVNENFTAIATAVTTVETDLASLTDEVADLSTEVSVFGDDLGALSDQVDGLANDVGALGLDCETVTSTTVTIAPDGVNERTATCGAGTTLTGGGCAVGTPFLVGCIVGQPCGPFVPTSGSPSTTSQSYYCAMRNTDGVDRTLTARARCCSM